jgi:hypothetical protein
MLEGLMTFLGIYLLTIKVLGMTRKFEERHGD